MRNLFIWENPIDWCYINPLLRHLNGENFVIKKIGRDTVGGYLSELDYFKPDNILVFRYDTFASIQDISAIKYQFYHGLIDKGFKCVGGQMWRLGMHYDYFVEPGPYYKERMTTHGSIPTERVVSLGYLKLDSYPYYETRRLKTLKELGLSPDLKTLFYAPTCREQNSLYNYLQADFQGEVLEHHLHEIIPNNMNMILKLHDRTPRFVKLVEDLNNSRIVFVEDFNSNKYLAASDIVLSDCSSIMLEAVAVDKPVIQYINNEKNFFKDSCDWWDYTIKAYDLKGLHQAIKQYMGEPSYMAAERAMYKKKMFVNLFKAGKEIASFIEGNYRRCQKT